MKYRYTSGPWRVRPNGDIRAGGKDANLVAMVVQHQMPWQANARLIAAAPDLLEACIAVMNRSAGRLFDTDQKTGYPFDVLLRAAIAKAEGGGE